MIGRLARLLAISVVLLFAIAGGFVRAGDEPAPAREPSPQIAQLIQDLKSPDSLRRRDAEIALAKIKPLPPQAIDALADTALNSGSKDPFADYPFNALMQAGAAAIPALARLVQSGNPNACNRAVGVLYPMRMRDAIVAPILIDSFKSCPTAHTRAAAGLAEMGPTQIAVLRERLKDPDPRIGAGAGEALGQMAEMMLTGPSTPVSTWPSWVKFATPRDLAPTVPDLADALKNQDSNVRYRAAIALAFIDPADKRSVPVLVQAFESENENLDLSQTALRALENMHANASDATAALKRALVENPTIPRRSQAAHALASIAGPAACGPLQRALPHEQAQQTRIAIMCAMAQVSPPCPEAVNVLLGTLGNHQPWAIDPLAKIGEPAVPGLEDALKNPHLEVRKDAVRVLWIMRLSSPQVISALSVALKDKALSVREVAAHALADSGGEIGNAARAEIARERQAELARSRPDSKRYSHPDIVAPIPPDPDHDTPLKLAYLVPLGGSPTQPQYVLTLHTGSQRPERLTFWKRTGDDRFQRLKIVEPEGLMAVQQHFGTPTSCIAQVERSLPRLLVDVPVDMDRAHWDRVFVFDQDRVDPVEIESPEKWYEDKLAPGEKVWGGPRISLSNRAMEFSFFIWNPADPIACPTGGKVTGTFKLVQEGYVGVGGDSATPIYDRSGRVVGLKSVPVQIDTSSTPIWKLVPNSATRSSPK